MERITTRKRHRLALYVPYNYVKPLSTANLFTIISCLCKHITNKEML